MPNSKPRIVKGQAKSRMGRVSNIEIVPAVVEPNIFCLKYWIWNGRAQALTPTCLYGKLTDLGTKDRPFELRPAERRLGEGYEVNVGEDDAYFDCKPYTVETVIHVDDHGKEAAVPRETLKVNKNGDPFWGLRVDRLDLLSALKDKIIEAKQLEKEGKLEPRTTPSPTTEDHTELAKAKHIEKMRKVLDQVYGAQKPLTLVYRA